MIEAPRLGEIVNVPDDRSYGYHSFMLGLKMIGKDDTFKRVTDLRYELYKHGERCFEKLRRHVIYGAMPNKNEEKAKNYWNNRILA